jgi:thiamine-monophosphate kinase
VRRVRDIGEFALIDALARFVPSSSLVIKGIGDDCAVLRMGDRVMLVSTDMFVEEVHFLRSHAAPEQIGWKAAAAGLSDIAAMGGMPLFGLVSLSAPADEQVSFLESMYQGISAAFAAQGAVLVGGDTTRSPDRLVLDIVAIGEAISGRYCTRAGARPGDLLAVTGYPGQSAAGLHAIQNKMDAPQLVERHYHPNPRVREAQWLVAQGGLHALIDVSDGLVQDTGHLARAAGLGAQIERKKLPVAAALTEFGKKHGLQPHPFILTGGEDYELALALDPVRADNILEGFAGEFEIPLTVVGEFSDKWQEVRVDGEKVPRSGYDHFRA